jgi:quercetin dioxygenase-like cupin family protein
MGSETIDKTIDRYIADGFRLEMIFPADAPRVAELSRGDERIRIESETVVDRDGEWHSGRAGMLYRDLIPDRLGGRIIASNIKIPVGGPIPDYVHYHRIDFQMIYCLRGSAWLVYEDQGDPFRFEAGDCVLQPPKIRHRVLECSDSFEVFEVASPAGHPTFAEHSFELPTPFFEPDRSFGGQRFRHHRAADAKTKLRNGITVRPTGLGEASAGAGDVYVVASPAGGIFETICGDDRIIVIFVSAGELRATDRSYARGTAAVYKGAREIAAELGPGAEVVVVEIG